jgi:hypothetical protein
LSPTKIKFLQCIKYDGWDLNSDGILKFYSFKNLGLRI